MSKPTKRDTEKNSNDEFLKLNLSQNFREILPSQFVDEILYAFVLCKYGDEGEALLDQLPATVDHKVREALHEYFSSLDQLSMEHINRITGKQHED